MLNPWQLPTVKEMFLNVGDRYFALRERSALCSHCKTKNMPVKRCWGMHIYIILYPKLLHPAWNLEQLPGWFTLRYLITVPEGLQAQTTVLEDPCKKNNATLFLARETINCTSRVGQKSLHWKSGKKVNSVHLSPDITCLCKFKVQWNTEDIPLIGNTGNTR